MAFRTATFAALTTLLVGVTLLVHAEGGLVVTRSVNSLGPPPRPLGYSDYQPDLLGSLLGTSSRVLSPYYVPPYYGYGYGYNNFATGSPFIGGSPVNPGPNPAYNPPGYQWVQYR